jgi:hypothetical protein
MSPEAPESTPIKLGDLVVAFEFVNRTKVAARDASALGMDAAAVVAVIQALQYPADFDKSATAHHNPQQWHDSYKPVVDQRTLYLKFTVDDEGKFLLTSFKEA